MLIIGCPQHVCAAGKSTSTPSRRSSVTTARPVSGNSASLMHVTIRATLTRRSFRRPRGRAASGRGCAATRARSVGRGRGSTAPAARACTSTLPRAVASTGPANTGRPVRSAIAWQSRAFWLPPPTTCTTPTVATGQASAARSSAVAIGRREALDDAAHHGHRDRSAERRRARRTTPRSGPACRRAEGTVGPARRRPAPGRRTPRLRAARPAGRASPQVRNVSLSSQVPITLLQEADRCRRRRPRW